MDATQWDERYRASAGGVWATQPPAVVREIAAALAPGAAIDVATGDGRTAVWLAERGWRCTGVDFSEAGLALAAARPGGDAVTWVHADVHEWEPAAPIDLVVSCYLHLADSAAAVARIAEWVAPGGTLLVIGHDVENIAAGGHGPSDPAILYTPELLRGALDDRFRVERCERIVRTSADAELRDGHAAAAIDTLLHAVRVR
ncbi:MULTISPECIES: bifunctional 2-polyprenyl-6-hydroxyphenol methylase/3-demethylubiquinol 3-O-methyltransferase UbiG [Microbacterium]|uniref:class I SAM-dependent methyltransferase n=1 Tax=Microbacterium TaxID=33882 RepID=UPI00277DE163|nr:MULTISPECIES: class I SAM-dependent methyltransferase [Microbacterium]MDQ1083485.1 SAM-dependent methyltransferase [Microbacterium sp. SORGH_AS_0344]MDQ1171236.1 SAM-dependent methyltransferase [Microbacterium proteolyticum]